MTQEEKAKRYEEALERANIIYTDKYKPEIAAFCKQSLENIFPELKESEDERIRKAIIESLPKHGYLPQTNINVKDAVSWLEKQGEKPQASALEAINNINDKGYCCIVKSQDKSALEARTDIELVEEVYSHLDSIKETADRFHIVD